MKSKEKLTLKYIINKLPKDLEDSIESITFDCSPTDFILDFSYDIEDADCYSMLKLSLQFNDNNSLISYFLEIKHYEKDTSTLINDNYIYKEDIDVINSIIGALSNKEENR